MKKKLFLFLIIGLAFSLAGMQPAQALPVVFELNYEYSGGTPPEGPASWLTAKFEDSLVNANHVTLTMEATNLTDDEFISEWSFNFRDDLDQFAGLLDFKSIDTSAVGGKTEINFSSGENFYKAGPDGYFDLRFQFPTANSGTNRFTAGETVVVDLFLDEGTFDLSPLDFNFLSEPGKETDDKGPFLSAAHIQGIGPTDSLSGWIAPSAVPESPTMLLVGMGLIGLAGFGRRRFKA